MAEKPVGLAVPNYKNLGISGPYFGDSVWDQLKELILDSSKTLFDHFFAFSKS